MLRRLATALPLLLACAGGSIPEAPQPEPAATAEGPTRVFVARRILTMEPAQPSASAVAVADGRIVAVGSLASIRSALGARPFTLDRRFEEHVLLPGLVDNHLHPSMAALLLPMQFVTAFDWRLPDREVRGVRSRDDFLARLRTLEAALEDPDEWLFAWGYHPLFHGEIARADLDAISRRRPIVAWHRSFHELYANTPALGAMGISPGIAAAHPRVDFARGRFYETGLGLAFSALAPRLLAPERFAAGLAAVRDAVHAGGITTIADMAAGIFELETEWPLLRGVLESDATPFRVLLVPDANGLGAAIGPEQAFALIETLPTRNTHRLRFVRQVKLFADGAFYSQLMQLGPPGYLDGHHGEWIMEPAALEAAARRYWRAGYQIHVHVNGDLGTQVVLDVLARLLAEMPREDHRFTLHHLGYSTAAQSARAAGLGALVSANPYYIWELGDVYARVGLGRQRTDRIVRLGSLLRAGVRVSLHSDFTMAPAEPLRLAQVAATRKTAEGTFLDPNERLSLEQALRAVTLDAAHALRLDHEIGSIAPGKLADFTVLEADPTSVPIERLAEIPIWGTVFEGRPYPIRRPAQTARWP